MTICFFKNAGTSGDVADKSSVYNSFPVPSQVGTSMGQLGTETVTECMPDPVFSSVKIRCGDSQSTTFIQTSKPLFQYIIRADRVAVRKLESADFDKSVFCVKAHASLVLLPDAEPD